MKKILYIFAMLFIFCGLVSCSNKMSLTEKEKNEIQETYPDLNYVFLGDYHGYKVLFCSSMLTAIGEETIAGYEFVHPTLFTMYTYKKGKLTLLAEEYEEGNLDQKDIKAIYKAYLSYMKNTYPHFYEIM